MNERDEKRKARSVLLNRLLIVYLLVAVWGLCLTARLVQLQVFQHQVYRQLAEEQRIGFVELNASRGDIVDRHLEPLALSVETESLFAHPTLKTVSDPMRAAELLAPILQQQKQEIYKKLVSEAKFVYLARRISPRQALQVRQLNLAGLYFQKESQRAYPGRETACHVLGFVGDNKGLSGLEYLYDAYVKGEKTRVHLLMDAKRQSYNRFPSPKPTDGNILVLNIDRSVQYIAEQVLAQTVESTGAINGSAIVMDPHSGDILAMASYPFFNPNRYSEYDDEVRRNRSILEIYEPGSTFKIITLSAVLNESLSYPSEVLDCRVGTLRLAGKVYREAKNSYGSLTFNQILAKSSNVGTIKLGLRLGNEKLYEYVEAFGFGQKTGVDLPGEQSGLLRPPPQWSKITIGALSIGQEIGVTPLQMARAISVFANGGYLVRPALVRRIVSAQGDTLWEAPRSSKQVLKPETVEIMRKGLSMVVEEGTGKSARLTGYSSAGKTGTAQKFINGQYSKTKYIASYVGFAPVQNPALVTIVVINEPRGQYYGGIVAAPAFKQIMERALTHLTVPQDQPIPPEPAAPSRMDLARKPSTPPVQTAEEDLPLESLEETVLTLMEGRPAAPAAPGTVTIETGWFPLPDFTGRNMREVALDCARLGLRLRVTGSGTAVAQRPLAGSRVFKDTVCEVFFSTAGLKANASARAAVKNSD
jgi:cell division protein FtsI (penicillin-binding protein 3)